MAKIRFIRIKLRSKIIFNKKIAMRLTNSDYYKALGEDIRLLPQRKGEKTKYSTPKQERVTEQIEQYKTLLEVKSQGMFHVLKGIYNSNKLTAENSALTGQRHTNLMSLVASIPSLIISYKQIRKKQIRKKQIRKKQIRKNKGATTLGAMLSFHKARGLNPFQRRLLSATANTPDGINYVIFKQTSMLLKRGKYPWGASRRVYIDKPGQPEKKRPITIPPFMDRVVQTSILKILEAIYEPWFETKNRSFGFRSRKGVHDAIYSLTRQENKGLYMAIEGDIKGAYDILINNREILINILSKRINDKKFLQLIKDRLDYQFFDTKINKYFEEGQGIPQGGIDSPYLWNIYMNEFDNHITHFMTNLMAQLNKKLRRNSAPRSKIISKELSRVITKRRSIKTDLKLIQKIQTYEKYQEQTKPGKTNANSIRFRLGKYFKDQTTLINTPMGLRLPYAVRYDLLRELRRVRHLQRNIPSSDTNRNYLRYAYVRYADDWIILGNFPKLLAEKIQLHIKKWLKDQLKAELSDEKTFITNIRKTNTPAHFLGFEIRTFNSKALKYKFSANCNRPTLTRVAGTEIKSYPDKQRLISRLHMKGYCDQKGNPKPMSWMSTLETFALISRYNSVLRGLGNFYYGFVPKSYLNRWIYIIRFSLLKTLAQKYNTNIKGIFERFGIRSETGNTIQYTVTNRFKKGTTEEIRSKEFTLLNEIDIQKESLKLDRYSKVKQNFNHIEYNKQIPSYKSTEYTSPSPSIKDDDWVNNIMWVNLRTQASFDFPCSLCGSTNMIQMHHIKHIRKIRYSQIPKNKSYMNIMALRNRKQIPVCRDCHMNIIHKRTYSGANLKTLMYPGIETKRGYDNRLVHLEGYISRSNQEYFAKSLDEKGWKFQNNPNPVPDSEQE